MDFSAFSGRQEDIGLDLGVQPPCWYRVADLMDGRYGVFLMHRETQEWWRLVAVFASAERAEAYAGVENGALEWPEEIEARNARYRAEAPKNAEYVYQEEPKQYQIAEEWTPAPESLPPEPATGLCRAAERNAREVLAVVSDFDGPCSYGEIVEALTVCPKGSLYAALKRLGQDGLVVKGDDGRWQACDRGGDASAGPSIAPVEAEPIEQVSAEPSQAAPGKPDLPCEAMPLRDMLKFLRECGYTAMNLGGGVFSINGIERDAADFERIVNEQRALVSLPPWRIEGGTQPGA